LATRAATFLIRSVEPIDVPPYLWTINAIRVRNPLRKSKKGPLLYMLQCKITRQRLQKIRRKTYIQIPIRYEDAPQYARRVGSPCPPFGGGKWQRVTPSVNWPRVGMSPH
jgi:hypothetical protein